MRSSGRTRSLVKNRFVSVVFNMEIPWFVKLQSQLPKFANNKNQQNQDPRTSFYNCNLPTKHVSHPLPVPQLPSSCQDDVLGATPKTTESEGTSPVGLAKYAGLVAIAWRVFEITFL